MSAASVFAAGPEVLHFYSYATGVSIELPAGFTVDAEGASSATYVDTDRAEPARVQVQVVGALESREPRAVVTSLVDAFAAEADEVVRRRDLVVDEAPATTVVTRRSDGWWLHQTAVAGDGKLITVVGMLAPEDGDELVPQLDTAVASIRLITL